MNSRYPWNKLVKPGDSFTWKNVDDEASLRTQAHKLGQRRRVVYSVRKVPPMVPLDQRKAARQVIVVTYVNGVL